RELANKVTLVGKAITHVTHNEIKWRELIIELESRLPAGATLQQWGFNGPTSQQVAELSDDIYKIEVGGIITLDIIANRLSTIGDAIEELKTLSGVLFVSITSSSLLED